MRKYFSLAAAVALSATLVGCANTDLKAANQRVSDIASSMNDVIYGGRIARNNKSTSFTVPVDVDTASARVRQYYGFSNTQVASASNSFYRMAGFVGTKNPADHLDITLHKEGANITSITVNHASSFKSQQTPAYREDVFQRVESVALGNTRR